MVIAGDLLKRDFIKLDANDTISQFIGAIKKIGDSFALIFDRKAYCGFADKKELLRSRMNVAEMKMKHCLKHVPLLTENTKLSEIVRLLTTADVRALPVKKNNQIVGIVRAKDVVQELKSFYKNFVVSEVIKRKVVVCKESDELGKIINVMTQKKIDRVPVVDTLGKIIGVVSLVDILTKLMVFPQKRMRLFRAAAHKGLHDSGFQGRGKQDLLKCPVSNEMSKTCCNCVSTDSVAKVIDMLAEHDLTSLVVTEAEKPVGIITLKDLFEFYRKRI